jgi:hypothetical protein
MQVVSHAGKRRTWLRTGRRFGTVMAVMALLLGFGMATPAAATSQVSCSDTRAVKIVGASYQTICLSGSGNGQLNIWGLWEVRSGRWSGTLEYYTPQQEYKYWRFSPNQTKTFSGAYRPAATWIWIN